VYSASITDRHVEPVGNDIWKLLAA